MRARINLQASIRVSNDRRFLTKTVRRWLENRDIEADFVSLTLPNGESIDVATEDPDSDELTTGN